MPTDSGEFTGFSDQITIGESGASSNTGIPNITGILYLDAFINGIFVLFSSIGEVFGASGTNAVTIGIMVSVIIVSVSGIVAAHRKPRNTLSDNTNKPTNEPGKLQKQRALGKIRHQPVFHPALFINSVQNTHQQLNIPKKLPKYSDLRMQWAEFP